MLGNVANSSAGSLPLRSRSEVNRRQYEQTTPMPRGRGMRKRRQRQFPRSSNVRRTSERLHRRTVGVFWNRCARLALADRAVSDPA